MIPAYERRVSDLLNTVKIGSADALNENPQAEIASSEAHAGDTTTDFIERLSPAPGLELTDDEHLPAHEPRVPDPTDNAERKD